MRRAGRDRGVDGRRALRCSCRAWPIATTGARSQPPMHGARTTRTPSPSRLCRSASSVRGAGELAAEAVADPHGQRRRRLLVIHDDVEMGVERGDLVDLDKRQPHLLGQRRQMAGDADSRNGPAADADARSTGRGGARAPRAAPAPRRAPPGRPGGPSDGRARAAAPSPDECAGRALAVRHCWCSKPLSRIGGRGRARCAAREGEGLAHSADPPPHPHPPPRAGGERVIRCGESWVRASMLNRLLLAQVGDLVLAVAEPAEDLVGVLAQKRRAFHLDRRVLTG